MLNRPFFLLVLASLLYFWGCQPAQSQEESYSAPLVAFSDIAPLLEVNNDTTYVFNFWATWCKPCVAELPYFEELNQRMSGKPFKLYLISLDFPKQIETKLIPFMEREKLTGEVMVIEDPDANTWIDKVSPEWSGAIPATLIIKGDQRTFHEGELSSVQEIEELLHRIN